MKPSEIGEQAVIEGVMAKKDSRYAVAVRKADQSIEVKTGDYHSILEFCSFFNIPFVRGIVNFIEIFYVEIKTLLYSVSFYGKEAEKRKEEWEEWISTGTGRSFTNDLKKNRHKGGLGSRIKSIFGQAVMLFIMLCFLIIAAALFMLLPVFLSDQIIGLEVSVEKRVLEGVIRLLLFFFYLLIISRIEDIKRMFMYHGAEHKAINCIENGLELTVENVKKQSRQRKSCETSFLCFVLCLSIFFFLFIWTEILWKKLLFGLLFVFVIAAVSYELISFAEKSGQPMAELLSKPVLWLQSFIIREPEDDMILVAIESMEAVFDWKEFLQENDVVWKPSSDSIEYNRLKTDGKDIQNKDNQQKNNSMGDNQKESSQKENNQVEGNQEENSQKEDIQKENSLKEEKEIEEKEIEETKTEETTEKETTTEGATTKETASAKIVTFSMIAKERLQKTIINDEHRKKEAVEKQEYTKKQEYKEKIEEQKEREVSEHTYARLQPDIDNEDDPILKALDKFFGE